MLTYFEPKSRQPFSNIYSWVRAAWLTAGFLLTGCQSAIDLPPEKLAVPEKTQWRGGDRASADAVIAPEWWRGFGDSDLNRLMTQALSANLDLQIALARLNEAGTAVSEVQAARQPSIRAGLSSPVSTTRNPYTDSLETGTTYNAQLELNWELDVWGKLKKGVDAKKSSYAASEADWRATYLNTAAQVATTYFLIRQFDEQVNIQRDSLLDAEQTLSIYQAQQREGLVSSKEVLRQQAELKSRARTLIDLEREREVTQNALATLLGVPAGNLSLPARGRAREVADMPIPGGLPAELLRRRPDIIAAEYRVLEAYQLVGQARLAQLPSISLTTNSQGGGSLANAALNSFLKSVSFGLTPNINIPIFDSKTKARLKRSKARAGAVEAQYRKTVLIAFQEVEDALVNLSARRAQRDELQTEALYLQSVADQVGRQLQEGIATQLEVFEAQRRLLDVNQSALNNRQQIISETIRLYKAMGGGWPLQTSL